MRPLIKNWRGIKIAIVSIKSNSNQSQGFKDPKDKERPKAGYARQGDANNLISPNCKQRARIKAKQRRRWESQSQANLRTPFSNNYAINNSRGPGPEHQDPKTRTKTETRTRTMNENVNWRKHALVRRRHKEVFKISQLGLSPISLSLCLLSPFPLRTHGSEIHFWSGWQGKAPRVKGLNVELAGPESVTLGLGKCRKGIS